MTDTTEPQYYALVHADEATAGDLVAPYLVTTDPRTTVHSEDEDLIDVSNHDIRELPDRLRLVRLTPGGEVVTYDGEDGVEATSWTVAEVRPVHEAFGPQGELLIAADRRGRAELFWDDRPGSPAEVFVEASNAQYDDPGLRKRLDASIKAAEAALGRDLGYFWSTIGGDVWGHPLLALAARDLIGTTPEWTQEAYDFLTAPWVAAFGEPIHPADTVPATA